MRIGELAAVSGVTAKTIRYYEDIGVLDHPAHAVGLSPLHPGGHRPPRLHPLGWAVGLTLGEIRGFWHCATAVQPCAHVLDLITARAADLDRRISELQRLRTELGGLVAGGSASTFRLRPPAGVPPDRPQRLSGSAPGRVRRRVDRERLRAAHPNNCVIAAMRHNAHLGGEQVRLFPCGEMTTSVELVVVDEVVGIRALPSSSGPDRAHRGRRLSHTEW